VTEDTQQAIADDLGVSQQLISDSVQELREIGKLTTHSRLNTDEKRDQVREYVEDTPDNPGTRRTVSPVRFRR
jgi:predicted transcriptional regulator